jgi:lipid-A-disaccharide synthase
VEFVGHPLLDSLTAAPSRLEARRRLGLTDDALVLGLLPGSRAHEIERLLAPMREAAAHVARRRPEVRCVLGLAPTVDRATVERGLSYSLRTVAIEPDARVVMAAADLLLVASGTASLEAALLGTPMIICYRVSHVSFRVFLLLVRIPWIGLPNISLGRTVVPELYQHHATGARIGVEAMRLLSNPDALAAQRAAFDELQGRFGPPGVGVRAARSVLRVAGAEL